MNNQQINMLQGDDFEAVLTIEGLSEDQYDLIKKIYFSCRYLDIVKEFSKPQEDEGYDFQYWIKFSNEETKKFPPCIADYDITLEFVDGDFCTTNYRNGLRVLEKTNKL